MASVILKSLNLTKILNGRLSFSSVKSYYVYRRCIIRSYKETRQTKSYATAAYKFEPNEDLVIKNSIVSSNVTMKDIKSVDDSLSKIDMFIQRSGRIQMKHVSEAFSSISNKEMTSSIHAIYFIRACKYCTDVPPPERIELVNQIWNRYQELGVEFDVRHYNALLDVHISNGFNFNPAEILASMEDVNIQPNKGTYLLIMKKYCRDGNIDGASEILQYMKKEGLSADENVFNYLIEGHIKNNDLSGAKDMIEVMRSSNLQPNDNTYSTLASGYAAIGNKDEMMSYLKKCKDIDTINNYLKVIDVLATSGNHEFIDEVLSLIQHKEHYRDEFINASVEMIYKDQVDVAYKLAYAGYNPLNNESLNIFIKQLIRGQKPVSRILHFCERIRDENLNKNIYLIAIKVAAENGLIEHTFAIAERMLTVGYFLRPIKFAPLFASKQGKSEDIWLILKKMHEFGIPVDFNTYMQAIYPVLGLPKPKDVVQNVKASGQILESAVDALFAYYCHLGEIDYAVELTQTFQPSLGSKFEPELFLSNCANFNKESMNKCLKLLRYMFMDVDINSKSIEAQVKLLSELVRTKMNILEALLRKYEDVTFNLKVLNMCEQDILLKNPSRQGFVRKLREISRERGNLFLKENLSIDDENRCLSHLQAQNISCGPFLVKRVLHHIRMKDINRVSELLTHFEKLNLKYSPVIYANLISMYCVLGDIEKAMKTADNLKTEFPDFNLDASKTLEYANYLARYEKFDESCDALKYFLKEPYNYINKDYFLRNVKSLTTTLANINNIEFVKKMQTLLLPLSEEIGSKALFVEPLIRHHLKRDDLTAAFNEFKNAVMKHHIPACLNALFKKCIYIDDKITLQKVIDVAVGCSKKTYILLELAVAFIETFNTQKAVKIIENLGTEISSKDLEDMCVILCQENKLVELEQLICITRCLNHVNREDLYMHAFKAYANKKDLQKIKRLFDILKEEVDELKPETIHYVQSLLQTSNQPDQVKIISKVTPPDIPPEAAQATENFIEHLKAGNAEAALNELSALKKGYIRTLSLETLTDLIELCLQKNCTMNLSMNVNAMSYIIQNAKAVLTPILEKYSVSGDVEKFIAISQLIPDFSLMGMAFNTYFCKAFINSGKCDQLLSQLEERVDKKNKLYSSVAFEELLKNPEYEDRVFNLAVKYFDLKYHNPIVAVWAHYFSKENFEKADEIFKKFSFQIDKTNMILRFIRETENVTVALKYVDFIKSSNVRPRMKENAYGTALNVLVAKGMYDEAADLVVESEKQNLFLHKYYMTPLVTLKDALEKENKPVPFSIPLVPSSDSSSDSA